ncbi:MAG: hypothetical protein JST89_00140 [Cyanobacteria bacterium SZAS-4]|nr:hypothetical protein [Cyanobacteria bacterium SZAS-4]
MIRPSISFVALLLVTSSSCAANSEYETITINDEAVAAQHKLYRYKNHRIIGSVPNLKDGDCQNIIDKFEAARRLDPDSDLIRENLGRAYNNFGLFLGAREKKWSESLKQLHHAAYLEPANVCTVQNLDGVIKCGFRMNPKSFASRTKLADQARTDNDLFGAAVEYRAALKLKNEQPIHKKLADCLPVA